MKLKGLLNRLSGTAARGLRPSRAPAPSRKNFYHRGAVDLALADEVLQRLEAIFSSLPEDNNWAVAVYLLFSPDDRNGFNSWEARHSLKSMVAELFRREAADLAPSPGAAGESALHQWGFTLQLPDTGGPFLCRLLRSTGDGRWFAADADIFLGEGGHDQTSAGQVVAYTRALPVITDEKRVRGVVVCESAVSIAPHLHMSQRSARARSNLIYLTDARTEFLLGPHPGCDLIAPSLASASWVTCDAEAGCISVQAGGAESGGQRLRPQDLLRYEGSESLGVGPRPSFGDLLRARADEREYTLTVTARVLPRAEAEHVRGYGRDWCELSSSRRRVLVSLRLKDDFVVAADEAGAVFLWNQAAGVAQELEEGQVIVAGRQHYRWRADRGGNFYGSLFFERPSGGAHAALLSRIPSDGPFAGVIARGGAPASGKVPLLPEYRDDPLISHRGSVLLNSDGEGDFKVTAAEPSQRDILFARVGNSWRSHTEDEQARDAKYRAPCEFIFGSTRFALTRDGPAPLLRPHWSGLYDVLE